MNNIKDIKFIYNPQADICLLKVGQSIRELTIKGSTDYQGEVNGTWFQVDHLTNHWISFRKDRFQAQKWEVFYKSVSNGEIRYYRQVFFRVKETLTFSFLEKDEWVKVDGKWRSKY